MLVAQDTTSKVNPICCRGLNQTGQLGLGTTESSRSPRVSNICGAFGTFGVLQAVEFFDKDGRGLKMVSCGHSHTLVLTTDGDVYQMGTMMSSTIQPSQINPFRMSSSPKCTADHLWHHFAPYESESPDSSDEHVAFVDDEVETVNDPFSKTTSPQYLSGLRRNENWAVVSGR